MHYFRDIHALAVKSVRLRFLEEKVETRLVVGRISHRVSVDLPVGQSSVKLIVRQRTSSSLAD